MKKSRIDKKTRKKRIILAASLLALLVAAMLTYVVIAGLPPVAVCHYGSFSDGQPADDLKTSRIDEEVAYNLLIYSLRSAEYTPVSQELHDGEFFRVELRGKLGSKAEQVDYFYDYEAGLFARYGDTTYALSSYDTLKDALGGLTLAGRYYKYGSQDTSRIEQDGQSRLCPGGSFRYERFFYDNDLLPEYISTANNGNPLPITTDLEAAQTAALVTGIEPYCAVVSRDEASGFWRVLVQPADRAIPKDPFAPLSSDDCYVVFISDDGAYCEYLQW